MLGRLIKHEFRATSRIIPIFYLAALATAFSTAVFDLMNLKIPSLASATFLMIAGMLIMFGSLIYLVIRFYKNVYGSEGYLTMTLPVGEKDVLLSRGIVAAVWTILGCACMSITFYYSIFILIKYTQESAEELDKAMNMFGSGFIFFIFIASCIGMLAFLAEIYLCVTVAHVRPFRKLGLGAAVIGYVVIYTIEQIVSLPLVLFAPLSITYTEGFGWSFSNTSMFTSFGDMFARTASESPPVIGVSSLFLSVAIMAVCAIATAKLMKNKINLR